MKEILSLNVRNLANEAAVVATVLLGWRILRVIC